VEAGGDLHLATGQAEQRTVHLHLIVVQLMLGVVGALEIADRCDDSRTRAPLERVKRRVRGGARGGGIEGPGVEVRRVRPVLPETVVETRLQAEITRQGIVGAYDDVA